MISFLFYHLKMIHVIFVMKAVISRLLRECNIFEYLAHDTVTAKSLSTSMESVITDQRSFSPWQLVLIKIELLL